MGYFKPAIILSYKEFLNSKTKIDNTECKTASGIVCIGSKYQLPATAITLYYKSLDLLGALGFWLLFSLHVASKYLVKVISNFGSPNGFHSQSIFILIVLHSH